MQWKVVINSCFVLRVWGTKNGLGELSLKGPNEQDGKYDYEGDGIEHHEDFIMRIIPCSEESAKKWEEYSIKVKNKWWI